MLLGVSCFYSRTGMYGKLGHGSESGHSTPKRVEGLVGLVVSQIACGSRHTAIITSTGALYTWGKFYAVNPAEIGFRQT